MTTMWNQRAEAMSPDERAALQSERLGALVTRLLDRSPLYRRRLAEAGVEAGEPIGLDDLASLPFTTKRDLWDHYPWGMLTVPRDQVAEVLCCTPSYAARLGEVLVEEGIDLGALRLRAGVFGAEPWTQAMRVKIEALLGLKALDIYGLSEIIGPGDRKSTRLNSSHVEIS